MKIIVMGCRGQMGSPITRFVDERPGLEIAGGVGPRGRDYIGQDLGHVTGLGRALGIPVSDDLEAIVEQCDAIIDATPASPGLEALRVAVRHRKALVSVGTGFTAEQFQEFHAAGASIPLIFGCNTSKMVNVMIALVEMAARALAETDVEIIDQHDREKLDAPSGTARSMGRLIAGIKGGALEDLAEFGRLGAPRRPGSIGFHSIRSGDITSDHTVHFGGLGERLEISHSAYNDDTFARGAVDCAAFLTGKPAGVYSIRDVFGL